MAEVAAPQSQEPVGPGGRGEALPGQAPGDRPPGPLERLRYRLAARAVLAVAPEPESWLDVGCGYGRFCEAARAWFPYTSFDGLDVGARVEAAWRAGRVEEAHRGAPGDTDVLLRLKGRYDVVSFRGARPRPAALRALRPLLRPGGHLLVDPSPEAPTALTATGYHPLRRPTPWHPLLAHLPG
ncbi:methyltransferase domain-containing protein [Streptomyces fragilis]|uniref:Methyltransferase domain-containing protein n=1 Tax=Streptomyces fragilis TaxID=67301 RepID=A0ABV2YBT6_9ACTN|nr:methyltransferase domain-containing protein [Streptomyces fragilis]